MTAIGAESEATITIEGARKQRGTLTQTRIRLAMAFIALEPETGAMLGAVRLHGDAAHTTGEYAIAVRSDDPVGDDS